MDNLIGTTKAAKILGVDPATVTRMAHDGRLPGKKMDGETGAWVFELADVESLRDERAGQVTVHG